MLIEEHTGGRTETCNARILVVDDDADLRLVTTTYLRSHGYSTCEASDAAGARRELVRRRPDLVVLDLGLPDDDGLNLVREIRRSGPVPVVVVSGRAAVADRIAGLDLGADDYLVKPFSQPELGSRIRAVRRRSEPVSPPREADDALRYGRMTIDRRARRTELDGQEIALTRREFDLLAFLARSPGRTFGHEELLRAVWSSSQGWQSEKTVSEHVYRLRAKLGLAGTRPAITTIRGVGYRFDA